MSLLALTTKRDNARKALASASSKDRAKATAELEKAITALATFQARLDAKSKARSVSASDDTDEEDEDEDEDEDESEEEDEESKAKSAKSKDKGPKKPMEEDDSDDDDDDDDDDSDDSDDSDDEEEEDEDADEDEDEEEDEDEDEEARASAIASARGVLRSAKKLGDKATVAAARANFGAVKRAVKPKALTRFRDLKAVCQRITGKKSIPAILGALESQAVTAKGTEKLSAKVARMQADQRRAKVSSMLSAARREGKITKDEQKTLAADGMKQGTKWLRAHLDVRPKLVRSTADGAFSGRTTDGGKDGDVRRAEALDAQNMSAEERKIVETLAANSGKSFDDFVADMNKNARSAKR